MEMFNVVSMRKMKWPALKLQMNSYITETASLKNAYFERVQDILIVVSTCVVKHSRKCSLISIILNKNKAGSV